MRTVYIANDETEFQTEAECLAYEQKLFILMNELYVNVYAYDSNGMIIEFDEDYLADNFADIAFVQFNSKDAIKIFMEKSVDFGFGDIEKDIGRPVEVRERYFYDYAKDKWKCLEDERKELNRIAKIFEGDSYD
jgi:hypothetical protein